LWKFHEELHQGIGLSIEALPQREREVLLSRSTLKYDPPASVTKLVGHYSDNHNIRNREEPIQEIIQIASNNSVA
jgi:hypothetical protein